jgi:hypothetical protein
MTSITPSQTIPTVYSDLIEKYSLTYGAGWTNRVQPMIERLQLACETKDLAVLLDLLLPRNPFLREVFTRLTNTALPELERAIRVVLEEFVGPDKVAAYQQLVEQQRKLRQIEKLKDKVAERTVNTTSYGIQRMDEFIRRLIADGYTIAREYTRGAAKSYGLYNAEHSGYRFKRKVEYQYMCYLLERQAAAVEVSGIQREEQVKPEQG